MDRYLNQEGEHDQGCESRNGTKVACRGTCKEVRKRQFRKSEWTAWSSGSEKRSKSSLYSYPVDFEDFTNAKAAETARSPPAFVPRQLSPWLLATGCRSAQVVLASSLTTKALLPLWVSAAAVFSCQLAEAGLTGPSHPFEGRDGYLEIVEGKAGPMNLEPFGTWAAGRTNLKFFPTTANTQIGIWCAKKLRKGLDLTQLSSSMLHTSRFLWHESGSEPAKWAPTTLETADHSLPYTFTTALLDDNVNLASYSDEALASGRWRDVIHKIKVQVDDKIEEWPEIIQIRAMATMAGGTTKEVYSRDPKVNYLNPLSLEDIRAKFQNFACPLLGSRTDSIFNHAATFATSENCKTFFEKLAAKE